MIEFLLVGTGGILGAWSRYLLTDRVDRRVLDTLLVNALGSFLLGVVLGTEATGWMVALLGIGFCGAFTTFSTFAFETVRLLETGQRRTAVANGLGNLVSAVLAVVLGMGIGTVLS